MRGKVILAAAVVLSLIVSATSFAMDSAPDGVKTAKIGDSMVYVNADGMTLYTYDRDTTANKSSCNARCAMAWPPLAVAGNAMEMGPWTVITRDDGSKQWGYMGKPLYTYAKDKAPGDATGDNAGPNGTHIWHVAKAG